jgi:alkyl hydroperoxide reductase subunit F
MYDLVIVGGGPAGLTAAIYAIRKRLKVLLVSKDLGGKTNFRLALPWVEEYQVIRGLELVNKFRSELEYLKFAHLLQVVERVERSEQGFVVHLKEGEALRTRAVIIATGVRQKRLSVPGEREFMMRGLCYSAMSYAPLFIDRKTVVIGDGELALRSAAELATVARHVYLVGIKGEALDLPLGRKLKAADNVTILEGCQVVEVRGNQYAEGVVVRLETGEQRWVEADGTFIEMGLIPNSQMVAGLVELDAQGRIKIDHLARTSTPGVFAAGDVTNLYAEQALVAIGEGAKAALSAYDYLLPLL